MKGKKRSKKIILELTLAEATWLFRHAKMGTEAWLKENKSDHNHPAAHMFNTAFYKERRDGYHKLEQAVEIGAVEFDQEFNL